MHADGRAPRFVVDRAVGQAYAFLYPISGARDKCEALAVRDNRLLQLEFCLLLVSSFQDDTLDASFRKVIVPEVDDESQRFVHQLHIGQQLHPPQVHVLLLAGLRLLCWVGKYVGWLFRARESRVVRPFPPNIFSRWSHGKVAFCVIILALFNKKETTMLEKIFTRENALQRHRNAPLLQEREEHLRNFAKTRHDYHSLVYRADYLLKVVEYLNLSDDSREPVGIDAVREAAKKWAAVKLDPGKRKRGYPSGRRFEIVATQWLEELGMLDRRDSEGCIFNELLKARKSRLNAIGQPLFDERRRYLEALRSKAYCNDILRMTSAYMLHAIDLLKLDRPRRVGLSEIETAAQTWQGRPSGSGVRQRIPGKDRSEKFIRIVTHWLNFLGWLDEPKDSSPLHAELSGYFDWAEDVRGLSHRTIRSRICVLRRFAAFLSKRKTKLSDLDMETIDAFLIHRASAEGCLRRTIA